MFKNEAIVPILAILILSGALTAMAASDKDFIGTWKSQGSPSITLEITKEDNIFVVAVSGMVFGGPQLCPAAIENGLLSVYGGVGFGPSGTIRFGYVKGSDSIVGNGQLFTRVKGAVKK
ncbi:MAG: hypothetical protein HY795_06215 [Desulfovibrio sp.]|jgi:hypothetical protein|nr:hypothetical protein [Desulfovibrio sp.]MBI4961307.1 hypothetical protein [Desulfovibrio sp.]